MFLIPAFREMDAEMCALVAQVLPVFWLVVVVPGRGLAGGEYPHLWDPRNSVGVVILLAFIEGVVLYGAGHNGLNDYWAGTTWGMVFLAIFLVTANQVADLWGGNRNLTNEQ